MSVPAAVWNPRVKRRRNTKEIGMSVTIYKREKQLNIYKRRWLTADKTDNAYFLLGFLLSPCKHLANTHFLPLSLGLFFSHRNTMEKCQPHPSAGVQCTFHRCSGLIVLQFTIDTRIRYQHKVSKYEAEKDQTGHYSHIFVFLISCENCFLIVQCEDETKKNRNFVKWRMKGNEEIGSIRTHSLNTRRNANRQLG